LFGNYSSMTRIEPTLLQKINQRTILETILQRGPSSRAEVVRYSGISAPTVSKAVALLLERGLLEEGDSPAGAFGRPGKLLHLATENSQVIGIALEPQRCSVISAGLDGSHSSNEIEQFATPGSYQGLLDEITERCSLLARRRGANILGIGISTPSLVNARLQESVFASNMHIIDGRSPANDLAKELGCGCVMMEENNLLCLAERCFGAAKGLENFAVLDVTTGLGMGVITGGRLLLGNSGMAGEIGHVTIDPQGILCGCGNHGCLETLATDDAFARVVSQRYGTVLEIEELVRLIQTGEIQPAEEIRQTLEYLAIAVAMVINLFNPSTIFILGRMFEAQEGMFQQLLHLVRQRALAAPLADCRIFRSEISKVQGAVAGIVCHLTSALAPKVSA
jgi:predicted NBD/HSP70 family sugar kinase